MSRGTTAGSLREIHNGKFHGAGAQTTHILIIVIIIIIIIIIIIVIIVIRMKIMIIMTV